MNFFYTFFISHLHDLFNLHLMNINCMDNISFLKGLHSLKLNWNLFVVVDRHSFLSIYNLGFIKEVGNFMRSNVLLFFEDYCNFLSIEMINSNFPFIDLLVVDVFVEFNDLQNRRLVKQNSLSRNVNLFFHNNGNVSINFYLLNMVPIHKYKLVHAGFHCLNDHFFLRVHNWFFNLDWFWNFNENRNLLFNLNSNTFSSVSNISNQNLLNDWDFFFN